MYDSLSSVIRNGTATVQGFSISAANFAIETIDASILPPYANPVPALHMAHSFRAALVDKRFQSLGTKIQATPADQLMLAAEAIAGDELAIQLVEQVLRNTTFVTHLATYLTSRPLDIVKTDIPTLTDSMIVDYVDAALRHAGISAPPHARLTVVAMITALFDKNGLLVTTRGSFTTTRHVDMFPTWSTIVREALVRLTEIRLQAVIAKGVDIGGLPARVALIPMRDMFIASGAAFRDLVNYINSVEAYGAAVLANVLQFGPLLGHFSGLEQHSSVVQGASNFTLVDSLLRHYSGTSQLALASIVTRLTSVGLSRIDSALQAGYQLITEVQHFREVPLSALVEGTAISRVSNTLGYLQGVMLQPVFTTPDFKPQASLAMEDSGGFSLTPIPDVERHMTSLLTPLTARARQLPIAMHTLMAWLSVDSVSSVATAPTVIGFDVPPRYLDHLAVAMSSVIYVDYNADEYAANWCYMFDLKIPDPTAMFPIASGSTTYTHSPSAVIAYGDNRVTVEANSPWPLGPQSLPPEVRTMLYMGDNTQPGVTFDHLFRDTRNRLNRVDTYRLTATGTVAAGTQYLASVNTDVALYELFVGRPFPDALTNIVPRAHTLPALASHVETVLTFLLALTATPPGTFAVPVTERAAVAVVEYLSDMLLSPSMKAFTARIRAVMLNQITDPVQRRQTSIVLTTPDVDAYISLQLAVQLLHRLDVISFELTEALKISISGQDFIRPAIAKLESHLNPDRAI